jgi:acetate kinase
MADPLVPVATRPLNPGSSNLPLKSEPPEKVLVINCGSSSLKYTFYDTANEAGQARGQVERIGLPGTLHSYRGPNGGTKQEMPQASYQEAFAAMISQLAAEHKGVIRTVGEVTIVVHRVVHGGEEFTQATLINQETLAKIEALNSLAPLHNPVNVTGIHEMRRLFPAVPHVAVFDTAYHHSLPPHAFVYGLPYEFHEKKSVRRYGFHGTSHAYVCLRAAHSLGRRLTDLRTVSCHLGNGSSLCAVNGGRSVDTTMGFTPGEGLIMGTRCGDLDSAVVTFLQRTESMSAEEIELLLNKKSGLLGLSGISSDMREIVDAHNSQHPRASLALNAYCYRLKKYIGAYAAALGGLDVLVFTGGIGQGSATVRHNALQGLEFMGIHLDDSLNRSARGFDEVCRLSPEGAPVTVLVVPTDEERMMAREALSTLDRGRT